MSWAIIFMLLPFSCVYYPLDSLPIIMQKISLILPPVHIFESMRSIIIHGVMPYENVRTILFLNFFYFSLSVLFFLRMIKLSRIKGSLMNQGE